MRQKKYLEIGFGVVGICLLLSVVLRPWGAGRGAVLASSAGGDGEVYLPLVLKPFINSPMSRISITSSGIQGNDYSASPSISADGRYVAFESTASNLVSDDTNGTYDVFVYDHQTRQTSLVSVASEGTQGNSSSLAPSISADGRYVVFQSVASNLVGDDTNGLYDIYVHDRQTGETSRVSLSSEGTEGNSNSGEPSISFDGRYVTFESDASNLVSGDTNDMMDIFVHDRQTEETIRVSVTSGGVKDKGGSRWSSISANGRFVAFQSGSRNLVTGDTNDVWDIFVHDLQTDEISRVSIASDGTQGDYPSIEPSISANGRYVAFWSFAKNLVSGDTNNTWDVFVYDLQMGEISLVSVASDGTQGNDGSGAPSISADGRYVTFMTYASNLVSDDTNDSIDIFVHDQQTGQTSRISVAADGTQGNATSASPSISADGRYVAFQADASNLVGGDTNGVRDVFLSDRGE